MKYVLPVEGFTNGIVGKSGHIESVDNAKLALLVDEVAGEGRQDFQNGILAQHITFHCHMPSLTNQNDSCRLL